MRIYICRTYKIRKFAKFLGVSTKACLMVVYNFIHYKRLKKQKFPAWKFNRGDYKGKIVIIRFLLEDFNWWKRNAVFRSNSIKSQLFTIEIFSNSFLSGWDCCCNDSIAFGPFQNKHERKNRNYLELLAAFYVIKCFASELSQCKILLR